MTRRPIYITRTLGGVEPADQNSEEMIKRYPIGEVLRADIKRPRNLRHHQLYWVMLQLICSNLENTQPETLHDVIKIRTGHVRVIKTKSGIVELPGSINFNVMDQAAFDEFFNRAVDFVISEIIPGLPREDILRELDGMIGKAA